MWLIACCLLPDASWAVGTIEIQTEDKGVEILVDGTSIGLVADAGTLTKDVSAGQHKVEARKSGFRSAVQDVTVPENDIRLVKFASFVPPVKVGQQGESTTEVAPARLGNLMIRTIPVECRITVEGLNIPEKDSEKRMTDWFIKDIPIGIRQVTIVPLRTGSSVRFDAEIFEGEESQYRVDLRDRTVQDLAKQERERRMEAAKAAALAAEQEQRKVSEAKRIEQSRIEFETGYEAYLKAVRSNDFPLQERVRMWKALCTRWQVDPGGGTELRWNTDRVVIRSNELPDTGPGAVGNAYFAENFENCPDGRLPPEWLIVYNGQGNQEQGVRTANGNHYLRLVGKVNWSSVVRKEFVVPMLPRIVFSARARSLNGTSLIAVGDGRKCVCCSLLDLGIRDNGWHAVSATVDFKGNSASFSVDGKQVRRDVLTTQDPNAEWTVWGNKPAIVVGAPWNKEGQANFEFQIDDIRIFGQ